jgi:hypothetical protein
LSHSSWKLESSVLFLLTYLQAHWLFSWPYPENALVPSRAKLWQHLLLMPKALFQQMLCWSYERIFDGSSH